MVVVMVMRDGVELAAFAAFHDDAADLVMADRVEQAGLARPAAIGQVTRARECGLARLGFQALGLSGFSSGNQHHVKLGHVGLL
ncbi:MAG: hypothetical protein CME88_12820 [Hirschia sp.]|nr:hypothetical protein [Hirschia sp.]MBF19251.1 hypothetical protein [Hirschia sp.]